MAAERKRREAAERPPLADTADRLPPDKLGTRRYYEKRAVTAATPRRPNEPLSEARAAEHEEGKPAPGRAPHHLGTEV